MTELLRPKDLNQISVDAEMEKMDEERKLKQKKRQIKRNCARRSCRAKSILRPSIASTRPFEWLPGGNHQLQVVTFPEQLLQRRRQKDQHRRS